MMMHTKPTLVKLPLCAWIILFPWYSGRTLGRDGGRWYWEQGGGRWMDVWCSWIHISCLVSFFLLTLQQQTKMERSLCFLAGVLLLGGFLDTALMNDNATTESFLTLTNGTTATTAEPGTLQQKTDPPTPTTARSKPASTTVRAKHNSRKEDSSDEEDSREDGKTELGKERVTLNIRLWHSRKSDEAQLETLIKQN